MPADAPKTDAPPLIVISYSKEEEKWKDQLVSLFPTDVDFRLMFNRVEEFPERLDEETRSALPDAKVVVLLLSPTYLSNSWITNQGELLLSLEREHGVRTLPLLVRYCSWEEIPYFQMRREPLMFDQKPIAEGTPEEQTLTLQLIATRILRLVGLAEPEQPKSDTAPPISSELSDGWPPKELERFKWTEEVDRGLANAQLLARSTAAEEPISPTCLLFGLTEVDRESSSDDSSASAFLWRELTIPGVEQYQRVFRATFPLFSERRSTVPNPLVSQGTVKVFELAQTYSIRTIRRESPPGTNIPGPLGDGTIHSRHLVAALLRIWPEESWLGGTTELLSAINLPDLRERFYAEVITVFPYDDAPEWRNILAYKFEPDLDRAPAADPPKRADEVKTERKSETEPQTESDSEQKRLLAGFATDYWSGRDLLNIEDDVNAFASLVSAWSVEPPLSIGLFGDWGSGKSHFMRAMRQQVERLSRKARNSLKKQNEIGYYKNIVQIEFNAWHYIEGNLWASLVDHIFANLRVTEKEKLSLVEARRDDLMTKLGVKKEIESRLKSKIEEKKTQLKTRQKEAANVAKQAEQKKATASQALAGFRDEAKQQLDQLQLPIAFSKEDQALLGRLGIKPSSLQTAGDVRTQYQQVTGGWKRLMAQWSVFRKDPRRWGLAGLSVLSLGTGYLLTKVTAFDAVPAWLASIVAFLLTGYLAIKPALDQYRIGVKTLEQKDRAVELGRQRRIAELQGEVSALTKTVMDAESQALSLENEIADLDSQIKTTTTSKILAEFIEDRAAASDYRRHLGLLALIRRDFEKLRDLFDQQRREEKEGQEIPDKKRINRIVLYIDDLDRCPPQRVVEVLQAIHLLLAFPIFVVVVGVDARWVTRSLQESYEWLRLEDDEGKKNEEKDQDEERSTEGATPHDYLEKIFQIPFWLRPMEEVQCKSFIEGLTEQIRYRPPDYVTPDANGDKKAGVDVEFKGDVTQAGSTTGNGERPQDDVGVTTKVSEGSDLPVGEVQTTVALGDTISHSSVVTDEEKPDGPPRDSNASLSSEEQVEEQETPTDDQTEQESEEEMSIDLAPVSLTLGDAEIEYMTSLAKLIGRSPRAVKRFLNCYRLIKVSLPTEELKTFVEDGASYKFKAVMILLGIITGAPTVSLYVVEEIENWKPEKTNATIKDFLAKLEENADLVRQPDWIRLKTFLADLKDADESAEMLSALIATTPRVSRYSFRIARAEATGPRRAKVGAAAKPKAQPSTSR